MCDLNTTHNTSTDITNTDITNKHYSTNVPLDTTVATLQTFLPANNLAWY